MDAKIGDVVFELTWTGEVVDLPGPTRARALKFIDSFKALGNGEPQKRKPGRPSGSRNRGAAEIPADATILNIREPE